MSFRQKPSLVAGAILVSAIGVASYTGSRLNGNNMPPPEKYKAGFESISVTDAKSYLGYLAGPECAGRGTGQPGYQKAAEYVAARFKEFGLKPGGDAGTYFQNVPFQGAVVEADKSSIMIGEQKLEMSGNFSTTAREVNAEGDVVFLIPGAENAELAETEGLQGKIVFIAAEKADQLRRQMFAARPAAVFMIGKVSAPEWSRGGGRGRGMASGTISKQALDRVAEWSGVSLSNLSAGSGATVARANGSAKAKITVTVKQETKQVPNVVGVLPGSDPVLKNEVVGLGAHLDHLGVVNGVVHWGADDDGSGSTALLQVAKAFAENPVKPKRSIVFMAFTGEEMGLVGSRFYTENPLFPMDKMSCLLQMDMVGRNELHRNRDGKVTEKAEDNVKTIHLVGSKKISSDLHNLIIDLNKHVGFEFEYDEEDVYTRSDHYMFAAKGVPIAFVFSGFHDDYHQPTDTIEKINFDKILMTSRLFYLVASEAANKPAMMNRDGGIK